MRALLINPHVPLERIYGTDFKDLGAVLPPLGIMYLASHLRNIGTHQADVLDANALKLSPQQVKERFVAGGYDCFGVSCTTLGYPYALEYAREIRSAVPAVKILIGGPHSQGNGDVVAMENQGLIDFVCYGEGELAMESMLNFLSGKIGESELVGWKYAKDGQLQVAPPAPIPDNLDIFGHPSELLDPQLVPLYHEKILAYKELPMYAIMASRGCPFQCTFCSTPNKFKNIYGRKVRFHSVQWIIDELKLLREKFGVREVIFVDDTFNLNRGRVIEFCKRKRAENIRMTWSCNFEANIADFEMMKAMRDAGCWSIMVGGESGSDRMLEFIHKGVTKDQLKLVGKLANRLNISTRVSFILGMPTDTVESVNETINFVANSDFHFPYFHLYIPLPGTEMFKQLETHGKVCNANSSSRSAGAVNYLPDGITEEFLAKAHKRAHKRAYYRMKAVKNHLKLIRSYRDIMRYWKGFNALRKL